MNEEIRVSISCIAEFVTSPSRSPQSLLRPYKFKARGEGFVRSIYYKHALTAIRAYHASANDPTVFEKHLRDLEVKAESATKRQERSRLANNIRAIEAYRRIYGNRRFKILPNHRTAYRIGELVVTAQPDLWVEEDGTQVILKIGIAKKKAAYVDVLLTILRKAVVSSGHRIRAKNVLYLDVKTGKELVCTGGLGRFNRMFREKAREIMNVWPTLK